MCFGITGVKKISLPKDLFMELEKLMNESGGSRSAVITGILGRYLVEGGGNAQQRIQPP
jgi:metal-responsive CopG/Arc/MetJ family transcriptional regulator